jgi:hypothetical protein
MRKHSKISFSFFFFRVYLSCFNYILVSTVVSILNLIASKLKMRMRKHSKISFSFFFFRVYLSCFSYILISTVVSILDLIFLKDGPKITSLTFYFINKFRFYKKNNLINYSSKCFKNDENRLNYKKKTGIP